MAAAWSLRAMAALPWDLKDSDSGVVGETVGLSVPAFAVVLLLLLTPAAGVEPAVSLPFSFS